MALFIVRHRHEAERCPAVDPEMGARLLNHLSRPNVARQGLEIRGEAVVQGEHTLYLIVESGNERCVRDFVEPLSQAGSVEIHAASTCARVVASGGCAASMPVIDNGVDPDEACQRAIDSGLVVHRAHPLNCETSIAALIGSVVMPNAHFYVRNHFHVPALDASSWRLEVGGLVERRLSLGLRDLRNMSSQRLVVTLECAGNGRSLLRPAVDGEKWGLGAVSTAEWTGVPLVDVLDRARLKTNAREIVFRAADGGKVAGRTEAIRFERSLQIDDARDAGALLAYAMNGEPLPVQHGHPLRLVVPGWYGVASVKWLTGIEAIGHAFGGYFQVEKYWYEWHRNGKLVREPVKLQRVRALITEPGPGEERECGELLVRGVAWSGAAAIETVEVSVGGGSWQAARLLGDRHRRGWQWWELSVRVHQPGRTTVRARATDQAGRVQPEQPVWNRLGYGANAIQEVPIRLR
jgi:DMSO/TMAO reductase YedYZ molybdopterin-dependent catalytic subunit